MASALIINSMKSDNPHSGIYEADTARTIDQNGGNPACNQGGMLIHEQAVYDITHGSMAQESIGVTPTLTSRMGTGGNQVPILQEPACNQGGMLVFEPRSQDGVPRISNDGLCPTINTAQGGQRQPCIVEPRCSYQRVKRGEKAL